MNLFSNTVFNLSSKRLANIFAATCLNILFSLSVQATAIDVSTPRPLIPPNVTTTSNRPMVMMAASKDHSLFGPIYTDFEDLDGDDVIDTTFTPTFKYYGYFDSTKCYAYSTSDGRFNPASIANIKTTTTTITSSGTTITSTLTVTTVDSTGSTSSTTTTTSTSTSSTNTPIGTSVTNTYACPSSQSYWSGNFLNWSSMTRIDVIRKMLYGGKRSTDTTASGVGTTVLERAQLSWDAHAFTKYYRGTDIRDYTPFTTSYLTKTTGSNANVYAGLTICNLGSIDSASSSSNYPIMRMVRGNVRFWSTVEIQLCQWRDTYSSGTFGPKLARYYKDADKGNGVVAHEITIPSLSTDGASYNSIGPELTVRIKVCDPLLLGEERCQAFPSTSTTNYKPYGLFQEFGYPNSSGVAKAEFGVITGSYVKNYTAGALRKNVGDFADEINANTGVFCHSASSGCSTTLAAPDGRTTGVGAIKAFDAIRLNDRVAGGYGASGTPSSVTEGTLSAWGNPMGEMLVQALQYYSNVTSTNPPSSSSDKDAQVGMPVTAWTDPWSTSNTTRASLYGNAVCRPMNVLLLSHSALSFDGQAATPFSTLLGSPNIDTYTNLVGSAEGFNGTLRSIGSVTGGYGSSCSAKTVGTLSQVSGICPEAPAMGGTYQVAGAALYGNTTPIRTVTSPPSDLPKVKDALKVKTLAASLTGGAPLIKVLVPGTGTSTSNPKKYIYITPESVQSGGGISAPLTFASISSSNTYGAFIVTWNDILMGGDYDMDITGFLRYDLVDSTGASNANGPYIKITTDIPGVCGGGAGTHGFSIIGVTDDSGTSKNGRYLTHSHLSSGILSGMPATSEYLCGDNTYRGLFSPTSPIGPLNTTYNNLKLSSPSFSGAYSGTVCNVTGDGSTGDPGISNLTSYCTVKNVDYPVSLTFKMTGETDALIKDPLYYAAKYGSYDSSTKDSVTGIYTNRTISASPLIPSVDAWDKYKTDGTVGADDIPDSYFLARRPDLLEQQLRKALDALAKNANAAPATTSSQLAQGSFKYVAKFDSTAVSGNIEAYQVQNNGLFSTSASWLAGNLLRDRTSGTNNISGDKGASRNITTNYGNTSTSAVAGVPFRWNSLPAGYITQMTTASTNKLSTTNAQLTLDYIRGDWTNEKVSTGLRERGDSLLGPLVNATPWLQPVPSANLLSYQNPGYSDFVATYKARDKLLWASANDGMLHAFNPDSGAEVFAYVPGVLANRLAEIPLQRGTTARTRLNGANFTLDSAETQPDSTVWAYVDGSPYTADVKTNIIYTTTTLNGVTVTAETGGTWKTYAFSSLGRGGKALFALDVTNTSTLLEGNASSIFKWQFSSDDDSDLGYILSDIKKNTDTNQPNPVVRLNNGKYALLINNGYKSTNGKAVLYLLMVDGPSATTGQWSAYSSTNTANYNYVKIVADAGTGNGLSAPTWIDRDLNGTADTVYAGDLKGNMWKFDISSTDPANWKVAYQSAAGANRPLFTAQYTRPVNNISTTTPLPITTAPEFVFPSFDGLIINFGTGYSLEAGDFPNTALQQRFYGIWDRPAFATSAANSTGPMIAADMSTLLQRTYTRDSSGNLTVTANSTSGSGSSTVNTYTAITWGAQDGWYFNLPGTSEMVLSDPDLQAGFLIFPSVRQKDSGINCFDTPLTTLYIIDPIAGRPTRLSQGVTSTNNLIAGTAVNSQKWVTINNRTSAPWTGSTTTNSDGTTTNTAAVCKDGQAAKAPNSGDENRTLCYWPNGRVQWREIPGLRTDQ
jgi:type IV pilus assembly protein PilY1